MAKRKGNLAEKQRRLKAIIFEGTPVKSRILAICSNTIILYFGAPILFWPTVTCKKVILLRTYLRVINFSYILSKINDGYPIYSMAWLESQKK